ncbi:hypothetical protein ALC57_02552 [Trachymyrmex cornetzi]|uniref:CCHC-type domain-containing protein n=1 Tax=Trachymyrmex cornetzi TaxID=471704 RepID=A0A151JNF5_9HYME|nr:hypothetical protein ALC57_02552 [Trachymyrmex cornetzi]
MDRAQLDKLSIDELQEVAQRHQLPLCEDPRKLIDLIMSYLERKSSSASTSDTGTSKQASGVQFALGGKPTPGSSVTKEPTTGPTTIQAWQVSSDVASLIATVVNPMQQMHQEILEGQKRQQEIMMRMLESLTGHKAPPANESPEGPTMQLIPETVSPISRGASPSSQRTTLSTVPTLHAVSLLATQIPEYGGQETENVHKLVKLAKRWYDIGSGTMLESWPGFKDAILKRFSRKTFYHVALQKIEARKWYNFKESFIKYAMDKLTLMHDLDLPQESAIHLLISGILSRSLRETAAALNVESVDSFLDAMHKITSVNMDSDKRLTNDSRSVKAKDMASKKGGKSSQTTQAEQKDGTPSCRFCKTPGHTYEDCRKRQWRERLQTTPKTTPALPSTTSPPAVVSAVEVTRENHTVAHIQLQGRNLQLNNIALEVKTFNNIKCDLSALIDTGSPISFVKPSVYHEFCNETLHAIKNSPSKLLLGYDRRKHSDKILTQLITQLANIDIDLVAERQTNRDIATETTRSIREYNNVYYDHKHKTPSQYKVGDYVMIRKMDSKPGQNSKLLTPFKGPYQINKVLNNNRYVVTDIPGFNVTQKPYSSVLSPEN